MARRLSTVTGTDGSDTLYGDKSGDMLHGKGAGQVVNGLDGNDMLYGDASGNLYGHATGGK